MSRRRSNPVPPGFVYRAGQRSRGVGSAVAPGQRLNHLRKGQVELRVAADMVSENEVEVGVEGVGPW